MAYQSGVTRVDLQNLVQEYRADENTFVADRVFAPLGMDLQSATVSVFTRESMLTPVSLDKTKDGFTVADTALGSMTYACLPKGSSEVVDAQMQEPPGFNTERDTINAILLRCALGKEIEAASLLQDTSVWDDTTGPYYDGSVWATIASSTPIADITTAARESEELTGIAPDTLVINSKQLQYLLTSTEVKGRFPGADVVSYQLMLNNLASVFGLSKLFVSRARKNTSKAIDTFTGATVWSDSYAMVCKTVSPGEPLTAPSIGRTLEWSPDGMGWSVDAEYVGANKKQWVYTVSRNYQQKVIDPAFGCLVKVD